MKNALRSHVAAALLLLPVSAAFVAAPAAAQSRSSSVIYEVAVKGTGGLREGEMLFLRVTGTPGATSGHVTMGGGVRVELQEQGPGAYTATHTIRPGDRIDPRQPLVAVLNWQDGSRTRNGAFPREFQALGLSQQGVRRDEDVRPSQPARPHRPAQPPVATAPSIQRFTVSPNNRVAVGRTLSFTVTGQARGNASIDIPGVVQDMNLRETRPGTYEGSYTVRSSDNLRSFDRAIATLRRGELRTTAELALRADERAERPGRDNRPDAGNRPGRDNRPDGWSRPDREDRPDGERRRNREGREGRDGRNPQFAP